MFTISQPTILLPLARARKIRALASADRDKACVHGHYDCATAPNGTCFDELTAGLSDTDIDNVVSIVRMVEGVDERGRLRRGPGPVVKALDVVLDGVRVVL